MISFEVRSSLPAGNSYLLVCVVISVCLFQQNNQLPTNGECMLTYFKLRSAYFATCREFLFPAVYLRCCFDGVM